ncbi:MAG TPA: hypothetical protein VJ725_02350, partial [Thermoanaerobaculia bacterium]|nr:hypothetical protein [Thermoanaerobaculia bacterium]
MQFGLMFFNSPRQFDALCRGEEQETRLAMIEEGVWSVSFEEPEDLLPADLLAWARHGFPKAGEGEGLLPIPARLGRSLKRPDARVLAFFEGLLSALAESTEEEIDSGRWEKKAETARGPLHFRLALPRLLARMEEDAAAGPPAGSEEDLGELAADLLVEAEEAQGRLRIYLARRALELCPEMAAAYKLLGDLAPEAERALDLYTRGLALAERELDPELFGEKPDEEPGAFAGLPEVRQYMGLRALVAETLASLGRPEEAAEQYEEILRLDPEDEMEVRYQFLELLLEVLERYEQAEQLLSRYEDDPDVGWSYAWAFVGFLLEGDDSPEAEQRLQEALQRNPYVPDYLLGRKPLTDEPLLSFEPGSEGEAELYAGGALDLWESAPEALDWLDVWVSRLRERERASRAGRKPSKTRRR